MRTLERNKRKFYYATYSDTTEFRKDEYGNYLTGEHVVTRTNPVLCFGNISGASGDILTRQFGESVEYDKIIVLDNPEIPIDEYSVLWVDVDPNLDSSGETSVLHDYEVLKVSRTINSVAIAIHKVSLSA